MSSIKKLEKELNENDIEKVFEYVKEIWEIYKDKEITGHIKIGEDSFGLHSNVEEIKREILEGNYKEDLEYISLFIPELFLINFDFIKQKIIFKYYREGTKNQLTEIYDKFFRR